MIAGSDFLRFLLSASGVIAFLAAMALWLHLRPSSARARRVLAAGALGLAAISIYGAQYLLARTIALGFPPFRAADAAPGRRTAVVVLGSGGYEVEDWDGRTFSVVDKAAATRVLEAARVVRLIDPAIVLSSGGNADPENDRRPTGETMHDALITLGVPADRILVETASRTTRDEAVVILPILRAQNVEQVVLVTSQTHMRRALGAFRAVGLRPIPAISQEFDRTTSLTTWILPSEEGLFAASSNAHELVGLTYYWLRGWWQR
jgi:uncharacterized SAM-binding protein YcdF (DUF218 family)